MKNVFLFMILSMIGLRTVQAQVKPTFERITKDVAMKDFREPFIRSSASTIRRLYGVSVGKYHAEGEIIHSVCFLKSDKNDKNVKKFFKNNIKLFLATLPKIDPALYDGYRIHTGIIDTLNIKKAVYILTFGKKIDIPKSERTDKHPPKYYLDDNLDLGVYVMEGLSLDFEPILNHDVKNHGIESLLTHLSCNPHCEGDKLKPK